MDLANGCLLCSFHHHLIHQGHWAIVMSADGIPEIIPPPHIDPARQPLRHQRFNPDVNEAAARSNHRGRQPISGRVDAGRPVKASW